MISPAIKLINLFFVVKKVIILFDAVDDSKAKTNNGVPNPKPNKVKLSKFIIGFVIRIAFVKNAAIKPGLQGRTIAPKNSPYKKEVMNGFLVIGAVVLGMNLPKSILNINNILIKINIENAIGEIMLIKLVSDFCKNVVNINPIAIMNKITPDVISNPK